jgi:hypothetical protein
MFSLDPLVVGVQNFNFFVIDHIGFTFLQVKIAGFPDVL